MPPLPVIKNLDIIKDSLLSFFPCFKSAQVDKLIFQSAKKTLRRGVIIAVTFTAHAGDKAVLAKQILRLAY